MWKYEVMHCMSCAWTESLPPEEKVYDSHGKTMCPNCLATNLFFYLKPKPKVIENEK